jgi:hypothetical protein
VQPSAALDGGMKELASSTAAFKQVRIGASGAELIEAIPFVDCQRVVDDAQVCTLSPKSCSVSAPNYERCMAAMTYGGLPVTSVDFQLFSGRVATVQVKLESRNFDRLLESMILHFGKPAKKESTVVRAAGAEIASDVHHWSRGNGQVSAARFGSDLGHSTVSIFTPATFAEVQRRRQLEIQAGARDL